MHVSSVLLLGVVASIKSNKKHVPKKQKFGFTEVTSFFSYQFFPLISHIHRIIISFGV